MKVNFISNLNLTELSGGWSGISVALHHELSDQFDTRFVGPIDPSSDYRAKLVSKLRRMSGRAGSFHFFSQRRLERIAKLVEQEVDRTAECDFFHGSTPWILYEPPRPYFLYVDTCFSTYIDVYHDRAKFLDQDLNRILKIEAKWLSRATQVFFGTQWALEKVRADYKIPNGNLATVGAGGSMAVPDQDTYEGDMNFLFIALDFERKGGLICAEAFGKVYARFPQARLTIVGERPPDAIRSLPGVSYAGLLRKSVAEELEKLKAIYAKAFALIHPTSSDIQPLVISEAGYFGCPAIASNSFGIPELIKDGQTGFLIDIPLTAEAFATRMLQLCADRDKYLAMRAATREHTTSKLTWHAVGQRITKQMIGLLGS